MVATVGSVRTIFEVSYDRYQAGMRRAADLTERESGRMAHSVQRTDRATQQLNRTTANLRSREFRVLSLAALRAENSVKRLQNMLIATASLAGGFSGAFTAKALMDYSDGYKEIGNRLRVVKEEAQDLAEIEKKVFDVAQRSRATYQSTGVLFARISGSARRLGIQQEDVLRVTETIQKAMLVGGSTPIEAAQSAIQLSQGIASNRLQGDELRSVLENPALGQLLAEQISGGDLGRLRDMAAAGELTARVVINAFMKAGVEIDKLFAQTEQTIGQSFVKVDNAIMRYIGTSNEMNTASRFTVTVLEAIAANMETIGDSVLYLGGALLAVAGARGFGALTSAMGASMKQMKAMRLEQRAVADAAMQAALEERRTAFLRYNEALGGKVDAAWNTSKRGRDVRAGFAAANLAQSQKEVAKRLSELESAEKQAQAARQRMEAAQDKAIATSQKVMAVDASVAAAAQKRADAAMTKARAEIAAAEATKKTASEQAKAARSYYTMAQSSTVSAKTRAKAGDVLQKALAAELAATKRVEAANQAFERAATASTQATKAQAAVRNQLAAAKNAEINAANRYTAALAKQTAAQQAFDSAMAASSRVRQTGGFTPDQINKIRDLDARMAKQVAAADADVADARNAMAAATANLTAAQANYNNTLQQTSRRAVAAAAALRAMGGVVNFLGGPLGVVMLALVGVMTALSIQSARAQERADRYSDAIKKAGEESAGAAPKIRDVAKAMSEAASGDLVEMQKNLNQATADLKADMQSLRGFVLSLATAGVDVKPLVDAFEQGKVSLADFVAETRKLVATRPDLAAAASAFQKVAERVEAQRGTIEGLQEAIEKLKDKEVNVTVRINTVAKSDFGPFAVDDLTVDRRALADRMSADTDWVGAELEKQADEVRRKQEEIAKGASDRSWDVNMGGRFLLDEDDGLAAKLKEQADEITKAQEDARKSADRDAKKSAADEKRRQREEAKAEADRQVTESLMRYTDGLDELRTSGIETLLSNIDQKIVQQARSLGIAEANIRKYMQAVREGGQDIPMQMQIIADEMRKIETIERMVQLADDASNAFGDMFESLIDGSAQGGQALQQLGKTILTLVLRMLVIEPMVRQMRNSLVGFIGNALTGGMAGGVPGSGWQGLRVVPEAHSGWSVGAGAAPAYRVVGANTFRGAPRYHTGIGANEVAAILEKGETVLTKRQTTGVIDALGATASAAKGGGTVVNVHNHSGMPVQEQRRSSGGVEIVDLVIGAFNEGAARGKVDGSMARFGVKPRTKAR